MKNNTPRSLPIFESIDAIRSTLNQHTQLVLEAPPGAGKTTQVPLALLNESWLGSKKIVMLEPRRMAARAAAERMAQLLGEKVGETVGYRIRQDNKTSNKTRIIVVTEGILTRWLQQDPSLDDIALVIFDEFHERNLESDLGLALCLLGRDLFRDADAPLRIMLMSATLDGDRLSEFLESAPLIRSEGRTFPVDIRYSQFHCDPQRPIQHAVASAVKLALADAGNILVFLPGRSEIERVMQLLRNSVDSDTQILSLYGGLSLDAQRQAIAPLDSTTAFTRKIVLATDIAETSLTIEGVNIVIDSGLARVPAFDPRSGMTRLDTQRISQASSTQRAGRAGRLGPGICYRLWPEHTQNQLLTHAKAEILQADLAPFALQLIGWGMNDSRELKLIDQPSDGAFKQAVQLLHSLTAINEGANQALSLSKHGQALNKLPAHPRIAHMLIQGQAINYLPLASDMAALFSERDPFSQRQADFEERVKTIQSQPVPAHYAAWAKRVRTQSRSFEQLCNQIRVDTQAEYKAIDKHHAIAYLLACAYPDRIAKRISNKEASYKLSNGRRATLHEDDPLARHQWLVIASIGGNLGDSHDKVFSAAAFDPKLLHGPLKHLVTRQIIANWDKHSQRFIAEEQLSVGKLIFQQSSINSVGKEEKHLALIRYIKQQGLGLLNWDNDAEQWLARATLVKNHFANDSEWPQMDKAYLLNNIEQWLGPYIEDIKSLADIKKLPLANILSQRLNWQQQQSLNTLAPTHWQVASGSKVSIDYTQSPPVLAVKLQEMFGCEQTPSLVNNSVKIAVHLLSPARRPLQITQDLAGFWRSSYHEVKKEMKGRYPKLTGTLEGCQVTGIMKVLTKLTRGFQNGYYKTEPNNDYSCHQACHC